MGRFSDFEASFFYAPIRLIFLTGWIFGGSLYNRNRTDREVQLETQTDEQLVRASCSGQRQAYAELVRRHSKRVFAVCLGLLGEVHAAEDAAQDTLLKGFTMISKLRSGQRFAAWIATIARNTCVDIIRKRQRERAMLADKEEIEQSLASPQAAPDLQAALGRLPEQYRVPLMLYYFNGQSAKSVAQTLDLSESIVCTRLSRARKQLRTYLASSEVRHD